MSTAFTDLAARGLRESIALDGGSFIFAGRTIGAIINHQASVLTTAKSFFPGAAYPRIGGTIRVAGKDRQVKKLADSGRQLVAGGNREDDVPFVDDPSDPALEIEYGTFTK